MYVSVCLNICMPVCAYVHICKYVNTGTLSNAIAHLYAYIYISACKYAPTSNAWKSAINHRASKYV